MPSPRASSSQSIEKVFDALRKEGGIDPFQHAAKRAFGSNGLKVNGRIFAMPSQDTLVLKLPKARVDALVAAGVGVRFDPGHGRVMKEWIALGAPTARWLPLAREARDFVKGATLKA